MARRWAYAVVFLLCGAPLTVGNLSTRPEAVVSPSSVYELEDLKAGESVGYLSPGAQWPLGQQLGLGPYSVALLGPGTLLKSLLSNPALGVGYGGLAPQPHFHLHGRDPLVLLLLRQYGRYLPYGLGRYGLYGYSAPNYAEDNKPFGSHKQEYRL
ncbi:uncharacterized protein LOC110836433 [Zootermopsis nevadensis]|uniref:uncharacterized protein LOC110836433 n=1 Tax=Zootermopsis nevadensis TaxID=136037 RepID=UPI000B8E2AF4|nr:uncharacterized protein LOC110836433 [Zootermopsis nevadensis]